MVPYIFSLGQWSGNRDRFLATAEETKEDCQEQELARQQSKHQRQIYHEVGDKQPSKVEDKAEGLDDKISKLEQRHEESKESEDEQDEGSLRLRIHFTARLLHKRKSRDPGLRCGLFDKYETKSCSANQRHVWVGKQDDKMILLEDRVGRKERRALWNWVDRARDARAKMEEGDHLTDKDDTDLDWTLIANGLKMDVHHGCKWEDSLVGLIQSSWAV